MGLFKKKKQDLDPNNDGGWDPNADGGWDPNADGGWDPNADGGWDPNADGGWAPNTDGGWGQDPWPDDDAGNGPSRKKKRKGFDPSGLITVLVAVVVIGLLYVGVSSIIGPGRGKSREVITELQSSVNDLDSTRFIKVLDPETKRSIQVIFATLQSTEESDLADAFAKALNTICIDMVPTDTDKEVTALMKNMEIVPLKYGLPGKTRKIKCKVQYDDTIFEYIKITLQKYDGETCIKSIVRTDE